mgnify:CR=1 FL=1
MPNSAYSKLRKTLGRWSSASQGNVTIMFGVVLVAMVGTAGAAIDYIRLIEQRTVFSAAADSAVLAAIASAREAEKNGQTAISKRAKDAALNAWKINIATSSFEAKAEPNIVVSKAGSAWTAKVSYDEVSPTAFMSLLGVKAMPLKGEASASTTISKVVTYWDFHVVVDDSSSMGIGATQADMDALKADPSVAHIPVVIVSMSENRELGLTLGADDYFLKPVDTARLVKRLEDLTYAEAKKLDIGAFRGPEHAGQRIVSLADICAALKKDPKRRVYLDVKNVDFSQMARETEGVHEQVILATGSEEDCARWKKVAPRSDTFLWVGTWDDKDDTNVEKRFEKLRATGFANINRLQVHCHFTGGASGTMIPSDAFIRRAADAPIIGSCHSTTRERSI